MNCKEVLNGHTHAKIKVHHWTLVIPKFPFFFFRQGEYSVCIIDYPFLWRTKLKGAYKLTNNFLFDSTCKNRKSVKVILHHHYTGLFTCQKKNSTRVQVETVTPIRQSSSCIKAGAKIFYILVKYNSWFKSKKQELSGYKKYQWFLVFIFKLNK